VQAAGATVQNWKNLRFSLYSGQTASGPERGVSVVFFLRAEPTALLAVRRGQVDAAES